MNPCVHDADGPGADASCAACQGAPRSPRSLAELGLPEAVVTDLLLRHLLRSGETSVASLAERTALPTAVVTEEVDRFRRVALLEVPRRGTFDGEQSVQLTDAGRARAEEAFRRCAWTGRAPVPLSQWIDLSRGQSARARAIGPAQLAAALGDSVVAPDTLATLGAALNSDRALYLYGPSGTGKTHVAERLARSLGAPIWVPHAIEIAGEIVTFLDRAVHDPVEPPVVPTGNLERRRNHDPRWLQCRRPSVVAGGELTLDMLEMRYDPRTRVHRAPPQVLAAGGILVIDDLGRQRVSARDLLNRWIVPLGRRVDYLTLGNGTTVEFPFDAVLVFSSNHAPDEFGDPAFARRLGYKIHLGPMSEPAYRDVVAQACRRWGVSDAAAMADLLVNRLHRDAAMPLYPTIPGDVIAKLRDRASFLGEPVRADAESLRWAWATHFAGDARTALAGAGADSDANTKARTGERVASH